MPLANVLYVDDDRDWRNRVRTDFQGKKLASRVDIATSRDSGAKKIRKRNYDLIVVDGLEGECFGLIEDVREISHGPIVIFSGNVNVISRARSSGTPVYVKPHGLDEIIRAYKR